MIHITCNMGARDLPDMYARSPRATGPRAEGIHIRRITSTHVTTITCVIIPFFCVIVQTCDVVK